MNLIRYTDSDYLCIFKLFLFHSDGGHKKTLNKHTFLKRNNIKQEQFENTKGVIRICKSKKNRQTMATRKGTKEQTTIYKTYT